MVTIIQFCSTYVLSFPIHCKDSLFVLNGQENVEKYCSANSDEQSYRSSNGIKYDVWRDARQKAKILLESRHVHL